MLPFCHTVVHCFTTIPVCTYTVPPLIFAIQLHTYTLFHHPFCHTATYTCTLFHHPGYCTCMILFYHFAIQVSEAVVRQRKKLPDDARVTEDMCVTHFLIQPDPEGVKLQGWSERAFSECQGFVARGWKSGAVLLNFF